MKCKKEEVDFYNNNETLEEKIFNVLFDTPTDELKDMVNYYLQSVGKTLITETDEDVVYYHIRENYFQSLIDFIIENKECFGNDRLKKLLS